MQGLLFRRILLDGLPGSHGQGGEVRQRKRKVLRLQPVRALHPGVLQGPIDGGSSLRQPGELSFFKIGGGGGPSYN
jgi:hypothetical protein